MSAYTVVHPSPVTFVPARGRAARFAMVRAETPVNLRTDPLDAYERLEPRVGLNLANPIYRDADGLWSPIRGRDGDVDEPTLRRYLAGEALPAATRGRLDTAFAATPLLARDRQDLDRLALPDAMRKRAPDWPEGTRGDPLDLNLARDVVRDGRADASARLAAFLAEGLRIVGGIAFRRRTPLAAMDYTMDAKGMPNYLWRLVEGPAEIRAGAAVATPASFARIRARREAPRHGAVAPPPAGWHGLAGDVPHGADARAYANASAFLMRCALDDLIGAARRQGLDAGPDFEEALAVRALMREAEILAYTGSYGAGDAEGALVELARAADALWNVPRELGLEHARLPGVVTLEVELRHGYLPDVRGELDPEDDAALSALSAL